jgi:hypothetical protein
MNIHNHSLECLFKQLGLGSADQEIQDFINQNSPLPTNVELHNASFWTSSQSSFLQQSKDDDADWAEIVDQLDVMLRLPRT